MTLPLMKFFGRSCLKALLAALLAAAGAHPLAAELQWEATTIEQTLELGQEKAEALFRFENTGTYPVTIRSTSSSCGCTTAELERRTYYPGDKGEIKAGFSVGNRTGQRRNTVKVLTDDPVAPSTTLTFAVDIPALVTITPRLLQWRAGETEAKKVRIRLHPQADVKIVGAKPDTDSFETVFDRGEAEGEYLLELAPVATNSAGRTIISLQTDPEVENWRHFSFYAYIR